MPRWLWSRVGRTSAIRASDWTGRRRAGHRRAAGTAARARAGHAGYANLLLERPTAPAASRRMRAAISELTVRAVAAGTVNPQTTAADIMALIWAMRGLVQSDGEVGSHAWQRFLDIHLAGLRAPGLASGTAAVTRRDQAGDPTGP